ncbi:hypothetical protein MVES_000630 [Malassezia vespertilionis]|uniref:Uncharacterized protein n=1 Tax=Malassezia vespertilionis TaxID=2020962 RepID=A0A2N1JGY3_9BASI|nr:hypothetical protein MVES_000630 [Malassezia vespertilionis]
MGLSASPLDLNQQLAFYGAYHTNPVNVGIHVVCVPLIWMSALSLVLSSGLSLPSIAHALPAPLGAPLLEFSAWLAETLPPAVYEQVNPASVASVMYWIYYAVLDLGTALLISPLWTLYYYASWALIEYEPRGAAIALSIFIASWVAQFYGHGVHEGRAPALLDNLLGAVVLAPLFVCFEVLFPLGR